MEKIKKGAHKAQRYKQMKDWTKEVEEYTKKIEGMEEGAAYEYLWNEYSIKGNLSKKAHDWLIMWI